jgi:hypothetical protein
LVLPGKEVIKMEKYEALEMEVIKFDVNDILSVVGESDIL